MSAICSPATGLQPLRKSHARAPFLTARECRLEPPGSIIVADIALRGIRMGFLLSVAFSVGVMRPTRYAGSGDVHVAYQLFGGGPDLGMAPGFVSLIETA